MKQAIKNTQKGLNYLVNFVNEATSEKDRKERFEMLGAALFNVTDDVVIPSEIEEYAESVAVDGFVGDEYIAEIGKMYYNKMVSQV